MPMTPEQKRDKRAREKLFNHMGCELWERSGVGVKSTEDGSWYVTNAAINRAVEVTYREGIDRQLWMNRALAALKNSWRVP